MDNLGFIEQHNDLFQRISKACSVVDIRTLCVDVKRFMDMYEGIDVTSVMRIYKLYCGKLSSLCEENDFVYKRTNARTEQIRKRIYDYSHEADDTWAVQDKVRQIMAKLPKTKTASNVSTIDALIAQSIKSGSVGCKAVIELLKYPAYVDMIGERERRDAYNGSKSSAEQAFDKLQERELNEVEQELSKIFMQGYQLRVIEKKVLGLRKKSAWVE